MPYKGIPLTTRADSHFWADMTSDGSPPYAAGKYQGTCFSNPLFWFLTYGFARSLVPKNESLGHVGLRGLYLVRLMVQATLIHLRNLVAHAFYLMSTKAPSTLLGGAYITRVVRHLQLLHFFHGVRSHPLQRLGTKTLMSMSLIHWTAGLLERRLVPTADA
ncbi:hypothetical protein LINGRAHAP2_LOCUS34401 [Linum grandiflorum]